MLGQTAQWGPPVSVRTPHLKFALLQQMALVLPAAAAAVPLPPPEGTGAGPQVSSVAASQGASFSVARGGNCALDCGARSESAASKSSAAGPAPCAALGGRTSIGRVLAS